MRTATGCILSRMLALGCLWVSAPTLYPFQLQVWRVVACSLQVLTRNQTPIQGANRPQFLDHWCPRLQQVRQDQRGNSQKLASILWWLWFSELVSSADGGQTCQLVTNQLLWAPQPLPCDIYMSWEEYEDSLQGVRSCVPLNCAALKRPKMLKSFLAATQKFTLFTNAYYNKSARKGRICNAATLLWVCKVIYVKVKYICWVSNASGALPMVFVFASYESFSGMHWVHHPIHDEYESSYICYPASTI